MRRSKRQKQFEVMCQRPYFRLASAQKVGLGAKALRLRAVGPGQQSRRKHIATAPTHGPRCESTAIRRRSPPLAAAPSELPASPPPRSAALRRQAPHAASRCAALNSRRLCVARVTDHRSANWGFVWWPISDGADPPFWNRFCGMVVPGL